MLQQFWDRYIRLEIADLAITNAKFDVDFLVKGSVDKEAGTASLVIYNLADATRQKFTPGTQIILQAGYRNNYGIIFSGNIKEVEDEVEDADVLTKVYCHDITENINKTEVGVRYPSGVSYKAIAEDLFRRAGIPIGRIEDPALNVECPGGLAVKGTISRIFNTYVIEDLKRQGHIYKYYVRDGVGYFVEENTVNGEGYFLTAGTGLIDVQKLDKEDGEADYKIKTLMLWDIAQDSLLDIDSVRAKGFFRVVSYEKIAAGDDDYYAEMEVKSV